MQKAWLLTAMCLWAAGGAVQVRGQSSSANPGTNSGANGHVCECGAHPPAPPRDREVAPYAGEPRDLSPYAKFASPYDVNYTHPNIYAGAGRDLPEPAARDIRNVQAGDPSPAGNGALEIAPSHIRRLGSSSYCVINPSN